MNHIGLGLLTVGALALTGFDLTAQRRGGCGGAPTRSPECVAPGRDRCAAGLRLRNGGAGRPDVVWQGRGGLRLGPRVRGTRPDSRPDARDSNPPATAPALTSRLQQVLREELRAMDLYAALHRELELPRYANLARAEANHAAAISRLLISLGATPNEQRDPPADLPDDIAAAQGLAASLERRMIATYAALLEDVTDPRISDPLTRIQAANHRHLRATGG